MLPMLMRMLNSLIEHTPVLAAQRTVKTKWYIINRYNESHDDTVDESAVMLFLCDEQRAFLKEKRRRCTAVFLSAYLNSFCITPCTACIWYLAQKTSPQSFPTPKAMSLAAVFPRVTAYEALCALFEGREESMHHLGLSRRIWPDFGQGFGTWATGGRGAGETPGAFVRPGSHIRPQCGWFRGFGVGAVSASRLWDWRCSCEKPPESPPLRDFRRR